MAQRMAISDEIPAEERAAIEATVTSLLGSFRRAVAAMPLETPPAIDFRPVDDEPAP